MFKLNIKQYKMNLRNKEKYLVRPAGTVRLQKSAIYTWTKHMNKKHKDNKLMLRNISTK